ncbi:MULTISPECIES: glycosyltransferase family 25 protein [Thalassobacter]|uniref:glycosyltransferase family 25 protein n=1 Tax=Thalassobacter TaxID=266808 RepID=UPI002D21CF0D|nr:glycosyltransferase family 25 protein [Thalassobacter stenotrophicus]
MGGELETTPSFEHRGYTCRRLEKSENGFNMRCIVINLATAKQRMAFMSSQLEALSIPFQRIEAVTPSDLPNPEYRLDWNSWERPLKDTEKACFLSHLAAWKQVANDNHCTLILEDDALLSRQTKHVFRRLATKGAFDHVTLEVRKRKKVVAKQKISSGPSHSLLRLYQDRSGAAAYVLSPSGARKLVERSRKQTALADAMICKSYELKSFQIEPACAVQLDRASLYGIRTEFQTESQIDVAQFGPTDKGGLQFRYRRVSAQLRMAIRRLRYAHVTECREIELRTGAF